MPEYISTPPKSWRDGLKDFRAKLYSSSKFQSFCAKFIITRPIARANAAAVFDLCAGFVYSQVLYACVKLELLTELQHGALTMEEAGERVNLPVDGVSRLINAAVALKIVETRSAGRFGLGPVGAAVLGNPGLQSMVIHNKHFYADLVDPIDLLKARTGETELASYWAYSQAMSDADPLPKHAADYSNLMGETLGAIAEEIINAYPIERHQRLLDVGGGNGAFLEAVSERVKNIQLSLFDLPPVANMAAQRLADLNVTAEAIGGNMFEDDWPDNADLITLVRVALDHDDVAVQKLYSKARQSLQPGAKLLIAEPMSDTPKVGDGYFGLYLWAMGSGRPRTISEHCDMLNAAGFKTVKVLKTSQPILVRLIIASTN